MVEGKIGEELVKELREQFDQKIEDLSEKVDKLRETTSRTVAERPVLALGVAFVFGLAVGVALARSRE